MSFNANNNLTVFHDDNGVFTNFTSESADYTRDNFGFVLNHAQDAVYVGYRKPINSLYLNMVSTESGRFLIGKYFNGTEFTSLDNLFDDTKGWLRSGFVTWDRNQTDEVKTTINSVELFWYKFTMSTNLPNTVLLFSGINILFCDLQDLKNEFKEIDNSTFIDAGETYIREFINTRDIIAERLANTKNIDTDSYWDLLRVREVRLASTYLCLSQIFFNRSDSPDDIYEVKSAYYENRYETTIARIKATLDIDDDGIEDSIEINPLANRWVK